MGQPLVCQSMRVAFPPVRQEKEAGLSLPFCCELGNRPKRASCGLDFVLAVDVLAANILAANRDYLKMVSSLVSGAVLT